MATSFIPINESEAIGETLNISVKGVGQTIAKGIDVSLSDDISLPIVLALAVVVAIFLWGYRIYKNRKKGDFG